MSARDWDYAVSVLEDRARAASQEELRAAKAYDTMLAVLRVTAGNIRSLGPAGAIPFEYREWLAAIDAAISLAEGKEEAP